VSTDTTGHPDAAAPSDGDGPHRAPGPVEAVTSPAGSPQPRRETLADRFSLDLSALAARRREKLTAEIARNRRGEHTVPTWVLVVILLALVGGLTLLVALS
jgi:hypothetical protein